MARAAAHVVLQLELHGTAAGIGAPVIKTSAKFRADASVGQAMVIIRARFYSKLSPAEALIAFVRIDTGERTVETIPKMTDLVASIPPAAMVVSRESVFG